MFDPSAPHIIILLVVVLLLFGSSRLPGAARSLGKSMHIFKNSVKGMDPDDPSEADGSNGNYTQATVVPQGQPAAQPWQQASPQITAQQGVSPQQAQIDELQRQLNDLQRASAGNAAQDAPPSSPSN
ncbi:MAG TPA: Sec-independent protein translocase subunit TatA [Streptosporangiaceae bacterium]|nr:Sec-independent protein translocase subunit TatA [Streptosporangiaceae bacterium]